MVVPSNKTDKIPIRHYLKNNINILNLIIGLPLGGAVFYLILHPIQIIIVCHSYWWTLAFRHCS